MRGVPLTPEIRDALRLALEADHGEAPAGVDLDALGLEVLNTVGLLATLEARAIHSPGVSRS